MVERKKKEIYKKLLVLTYYSILCSINEGVKLFMVKAKNMFFNKFTMQFQRVVHFGSNSSPIKREILT
jgi:hypothetical protein